MSSNRPIKFRVWDAEAKKYLENEVMWSVVKMPEDTMPGQYPFIPMLMVALHSPIEKYVVEQFTGLLDKNGREIYEGDILSHCKGESILAVQYCEEYARFGGLIMLQHGEEVENDCFVWFDDYGMPDKCEVIGNIYDNPELLNEHDQTD